MGVYAYVRQVYLDVEQRGRVASSTSRARGVERPEYDRTVRAVQQAQARGFRC